MRPTVPLPFQPPFDPVDPGNVGYYCAGGLCHGAASLRNDEDSFTRTEYKLTGSYLATFIGASHLIKLGANYSDNKETLSRLANGWGSITVNNNSSNCLGADSCYRARFNPDQPSQISRGRTLGKAALGLRVVTIEGAPIRFRHAAIRSMGGIVDKWLPPGGLVGAFFVLGTPSRQRIGDLLAGTLVIRDPNRTALPIGFWFSAPPGLESFAATIDPTAFTVDQYTIVRAFLMRTRELSPAARYSVALDLATRTERLLRIERPAQVHPEAFLLCVIARYQRRAFPNYR
jgi:hypothetical protein